MVLKRSVQNIRNCDCFNTFKTYMVLKQTIADKMRTKASLPSKLTWFSNGYAMLSARYLLHYLQNLHGSQTQYEAVLHGRELHYLQNLHGSQTARSRAGSSGKLHYLQNLHGSQTVWSFSRTFHRLHYLQNLHGSQTKLNISV